MTLNKHFCIFVFCKRILLVCKKAKLMTPKVDRRFLHCLPPKIILFLNFKHILARQRIELKIRIFVIVFSLLWMYPMISCRHGNQNSRWRFSDWTSTNQYTVLQSRALITGVLSQKYSEVLQKENVCMKQNFNFCTFQFLIKLIKFG